MRNKYYVVIAYGIRDRERVRIAATDYGILAWFY